MSHLPKDGAVLMIAHAQVEGVFEVVQG